MKDLIMSEIDRDAGKLRVLEGGASEVEVPASQPSISPGLLDSFWDVVVLAHTPGYGRVWERVLWSKEHHGWRSEHYYGNRGFADRILDDVALDPDTVQKVEALTGHCGWCGLGPSEHLIAPDEFGDDARYCVQRPTNRVVGSGGVRKHLGSVITHCQSVRHGSWNLKVSGRHVVEVEPDFGEPLPASEIRDRDWCSRCIPSREREEFEELERRRLAEEVERMRESVTISARRRW